MNYMKKGSNILGVVIGFRRRFASRKIVNVSLTGMGYVQNTGMATERRDVHIYCDSYEKRNNVDNASNEGAVLDINWNDTTIRGYIEKDVNWREWRDGHGVGSFTFLVKEVIE